MLQCCLVGSPGLPVSLLHSVRSSEPYWWEDAGFFSIRSSGTVQLLSSLLLFQLQRQRISSENYRGGSASLTLLLCFTESSPLTHQTCRGRGGRAIPAVPSCCSGRCGVCVLCVNRALDTLCLESDYLLSSSVHWAQLQRRGALCGASGQGRFKRFKGTQAKNGPLIGDPPSPPPNKQTTHYSNIQIISLTTQIDQHKILVQY